MVKNDIIRYALLVEDNPVDWKVFSDLLNQLGFTVIENENHFPVATYEEAIKIIKHSGKQIVCAVIDLQLSGKKNGADIAEYIIKNDYPIRIIFTTAHLSDQNSINIAATGPQYGIITKNNFVINKEAALFQLKQLLLPGNPLILYKKETIRLNVEEIHLHTDSKRQLYPKFDNHFPMQIIPVNNIAFICSGKGQIYNVPKNYCLIVTVNSHIGYYLLASLNYLIKEKLDDRFIRVNDNTCINIINCTMATPSRKKSHIAIAGVEIKLSDTYRNAYIKRLTSYWLL